MLFSLAISISESTAINNTNIKNLDNLRTLQIGVYKNVLL